MKLYTQTHPAGWVAYTDNYDGAPDAGAQDVGYGDTEAAAIADLREQLAAK